MKILVVAIRYDQGNPQHGDSFEYSNFYLSMKQEKSYEVEFFPFDVVMIEKGKKEMNAELLKKARSFKPRLCFFSLIEDEIEPSIIGQITKEGFVTLAWFGDDEWRFGTHSKHYAPYFSFVATTYPKAVQQYIDIGYRNALPTASGVSTDALLDNPVKKDLDVTFIGSWSKSREKVIRSINEAGIRVFACGNNWPEGRASYKQMLDLIARSKISLGLNTPSFTYGWRPLIRFFLKRSSFRRSLLHIRPDTHNFFENVKSWRQKKIIQIKARTFEIPARHTLLITQNVPRLEKYYTAGKEIVLYKDTQDLILKIQYFLVHDAERKAIAEAGYRRTVLDHIYQQRFTDLFARMGL